MPFVTKYKLGRTLGQLKWNHESDSVYKYLLDKYQYFSSIKSKEIATFYNFLKDPKRFLEIHGVIWEDDGKYIIESKPAFHNDSNCEWLKAPFINIKLPIAIQNNKQLLQEARQIYKDDKLNFISNCIKIFKEKYPNAKLSPDDFVIVNYKNGGNNFIQNKTLNELQSELVSLLILEKSYKGIKITENQKHQIIPNDFFEKPYSYPEALKYYNRGQVISRHRNSLAQIANNGTLGAIKNKTDYCSDEELIEIAKYVSTNLETPTYEILIAIVFQGNGEAELDKGILETIGFTSCKSKNCV